MNAAPEPEPQGSSDLDGLFEIVLAEISKVEGIQVQASAPAPSPAPAPEGPAFRHVRETFPQMNPVFSKGVEYAKIEP